MGKGSFVAERDRMADPSRLAAELDMSFCRVGRLYGHQASHNITLLGRLCDFLGNESAINEEKRIQSFMIGTDSVVLSGLALLREQPLRLVDDETVAPLAPSRSLLYPCDPGSA